MESSGKVTMTDIAKKANVDQSTVSLALRNSPKIKEATKKKIQKIARGMGYHPNPLVSALMQSRRKRHGDDSGTTIAYVSFEGMSSILREQPVFDHFKVGAKAEAEKHGFKFEVFKVTREMTVSRVNQIIVARGIAGVVVGPLPENRSRIDMDWERFSSITIGPTLKKPDLHRVEVNHFDAMSTLFQHCVEVGYRRIGFCLREETDARIGGRWEASFLKQQQNIVSRDVIPVLKMKRWNRKELIAWVTGNKPDIIICVRSKPVLDALRESGYRIPADIAVATVAGALPDLEVSGIAECGQSVGAHAVSQLVRLVFSNEVGVPDLPVKVLLPAQFNPGETMH